MTPETNGGNGVRITSREVYDEVVACRRDIAALREMVAAERVRTDGLTSQVRLLWTLNFALIGTIVSIAAAFRVFA